MSYILNSNNENTTIKAPQTINKTIIKRSKDGMFRTQVYINGMPYITLIDSGASIISITATTAKQIGLTINNNNYKTKLATANGRTTGAPVVLKSISLGNFTANNIKALVLDDSKLETNIIGMNFLSYFNNINIEDNKLTLTYTLKKFK